MRLSIFNSSRCKNRRGPAPVLVFAATFVVLFLASSILTPTVDRLSYAYPMPMRTVFPEGPWYMDIALGVDHLSHSVFYYGLGSSMRHARDTDLLILGSSRIMFAFPFEVMNAYSERYGIRYFNMGLGHAETNVFPRRVMERHDLRPRMVIVNADMFFTGIASGKALSIMHTSTWENAKGKIDAWGRYAYHLYGQRVLPHFLPKIPPPSAFRGEEASALFRSPLNGSWFVWNREDRRIPVRYSGGVGLLESAHIEIAKEFRDFLDARGARLILTHVPSAQPKGSRERAEKLAGILGVPFISPVVPGLVTLDESHLSPDSADIFARSFLEECTEEMGLER